MEPQGRENVPARHTPERNKRLGLRKTTLASRESARSNSWAECRDTKKFRHRAEGEIFLLTFPFIGHQWLAVRGVAVEPTSTDSGGNRLFRLLDLERNMIEVCVEPGWLQPPAPVVL